MIAPYIATIGISIGIKLVYASCYCGYKQWKQSVAFYKWPDDGRITLFLFISLTNLLCGSSIHPLSTLQAINHNRASILIVTRANDYVGMHWFTTVSTISNNKWQTFRLHPTQGCMWNHNLSGPATPYPFWRILLKYPLPQSPVKQQHNQSNALQHATWCMEVPNSTTPFNETINTIIPKSIAHIPCLYYTALTFRWTPDPQTAQQNVHYTQDAVRSLTKLINSIQSDGEPLPKLRIVLTSSMAAVRATNELPLNGKYYTNKDWNTLSKLDSENWGSCTLSQTNQCYSKQWGTFAQTKHGINVIDHGCTRNKWTFSWWEILYQKRLENIVKNYIINGPRLSWKKWQWTWWWSGIRTSQDGVLEFVGLCPSVVLGPLPPVHPMSMTSTKVAAHRTC